MNKSETISELAKALNAFQGKVQPVKKDAVNPFFKSHYATLDAIWEGIKKPLTDSGLSVTQTLDIVDDGKNLLDTTLLHISGEWVSGSMAINPVKDDPQGLGSAISYARRYSLCAMLGVVADEDDDANVATKPKAEAKPKAKAPVSPTVETTQTDEIITSETMTPEILFNLIAEKMTWKSPATARSWIVNKCKIEESRIDSEPEAVFQEIRELQGWT